MNRLFHIVLILSILFSQSAWAAHGAEFSDGSEHDHVHAIDQHDESSDGCGSHSCHAGAHLIGIFSKNSVDFNAACDSNEVILKYLISSQSSQPPIPPPIS